MSDFLTGQLILEAFLFRSDMSADVANSVRLCSFALRVTAPLVNSVVQDKLPENWSSQQEALHRCLNGIFEKRVAPIIKGIKKKMPFKSMKSLSYAINLEILYGSLLQEVFLRQLPKYIFTRAQLFPAEIVDSLPARVARVALGSFIVAITFEKTSSSLVKTALLWGEGPGYLTETVGFAPAVIQLFAKMQRQ